MSVLSLIVAILVFAATASADTFSFGDSSITWPGWSGNYNSTDSVGTPNFLGGSGEVTDTGLLMSLSFLYTQESYAHNSNIPLKAGALFIDTNADGIWDYVVNTLGMDDVNQQGNTGANLFSVSIPENASGSYILSQNSTNWTCCSIRINNPVGISTIGLNPIGVVGFSGWVEDFNTSTINPNVSTFTFGGNDIRLGENFTISWMPNCANDVLYETINNPVPEPGSLILLGTGIFALGFAIRRKSK